MSGKAVETTRLVARWLAAIFFVLAGCAHFLIPDWYEKAVPPGFPEPGLLVLVSGICEIAGGTGLLIKGTRTWAGWGLIVLLIAVFPANIYMALYPERFSIVPWILWARLPMQLVFCAWVWFVAGRGSVAGARQKLACACGILLFVGGLMLTGCSSFQVLNATVPKSGYTSTLDVAYGSGTRHRLDMYCPKKAANGKVVVFFYGGSWREGSKTDYRFVAQALTSRGFIAVLPDYRVYPEVTFPAFVEDGAAAVRWVHDNISSFGGDTNQIYLMGHSAGAHIVALLTLDAQYLKGVQLERDAIRASAGLSGPYDFIPNPWDRPVFGLATNDTYINPQIEPVNFVDGKAPPMLLIQGLRDKIVSPSNTTNLVTRIRAAGGQVEVITYPNRAHATVALALASKFHWLAPVLDDVENYFNRLEFSQSQPK